MSQCKCDRPSLALIASLIIIYKETRELPKLQKISVFSAVQHKGTESGRQKMQSCFREFSNQSGDSVLTA